MEREIAIHSSIQHPNIVDFYAAFEDEQRIYLVLEFAAGGDLFDIVKLKGGRIIESEVALLVIKPYLAALAYLHSKGIIHRDIKPENTVFTSDNVLKVTDFGLAVNQREERPVTRLGTLDYMSPEVIVCPDKHYPGDNKHRLDLTYNESVDAWAMGVLAFELIVGRSPFGMSDRESTIHAITHSQPSFPSWTSKGSQSFICMALDKSPATRAPIIRLMHHPWILSFESGHIQTHTQQRKQYQPPQQQQQQPTLISLLHNSSLNRSSPLSSTSFSARTNPSLQQLMQSFNEPLAATAAAAGGNSASDIFDPASASYYQPHLGGINLTLGLNPPKAPHQQLSTSAKRSLSKKKHHHQRSNTLGSGNMLQLGFEAGHQGSPATSQHHVPQGSAPHQHQHQHWVLWADSLVIGAEASVARIDSSGGGNALELRDLSRSSFPSHVLDNSGPSFSRSLSQSSKRRVPDDEDLDFDDLAARASLLLSEGRRCSGELTSKDFNAHSHGSLPSSLIASPSGKFPSGGQSHFFSNLNPFGSRQSSPSSPSLPGPGNSPFSNASTKGSRLGRSCKVHRSQPGIDSLTLATSGSLPLANDAASASSHHALMYTPPTLDVAMMDEDRSSSDLIAVAAAAEWRRGDSLLPYGSVASGSDLNVYNSRGHTTDPWSSNRTSSQSNLSERPSLSGGLRRLVRSNTSARTSNSQMSCINQALASTNLDGSWSPTVDSSQHQVPSPQRQSCNGLNNNYVSGGFAGTRSSNPSLPLPYIAETEAAATDGNHEPNKQSILNLFKSKSSKAAAVETSAQRPSIFETFGRKPEDPQQQQITSHHLYAEPHPVSNPDNTHSQGSVMNEDMDSDELPDTHTLALLAQ